MLDERTACLLNIINENCQEGSYRVFSLDELVDAFPLKFVADGDLIRQMITVLSSGGFISLKFDRDEEFCLAPTPKGREYFENAKQTQTVKCSKVSRFLPYVYNFLAMFSAVFLSALLLKLFGVI